MIILFTISKYIFFYQEHVNTKISLSLHIDQYHLNRTINW